MTWSNTFSTLISATPTAYGLSEAQAASYAGVQEAYSASYALIVEKATRTEPNIATKNAAKEALIEQSRMLARIIQANPAVTDAMKIALGLHVRDPEPTPVPVPHSPPKVSVALEKDRWVRVELTGTGPDEGRPEGVSGATVFTYVGATPPADVEGWQFATITGKTTLSLSFATITNAATVWITAFWFNSRKESGPAAQPISVNLPASAVVPAATSLKLAA